MPLTTHFVSLRIIKRLRIIETISAKPKTKAWFQAWRIIVEASSWKNLKEVQKVYPKTDVVLTANGSKVTVFDVCGNSYRLLTAIHYNTGIVYFLDFLTHAEYDKENWKKNL